MNNLPAPLSIESAIAGYLQAKSKARTPQTASRYAWALKFFSSVLEELEILPAADVDRLIASNAVFEFTQKAAADLSPATQKLYATAVMGLFSYIATAGRAVNLESIRATIQEYTKPRSDYLPQYSNDAIEKLIDYALHLSEMPVEDDDERLRNYRDRALLVTLADSGLRIREACELRRGHIDWNTGLAIIIGKGDKQGKIHFSQRSIRAMQDYFRLRTLVSPGSPSLQEEPVFARHNPIKKNTKRELKPITTDAGRDIIKKHVLFCLGEAYKYEIHPHTLRHRFVSEIVAKSGNLKLAQELARHKNISVTQRYAHLGEKEVEQAYREIFD